METYAILEYRDILNYDVIDATKTLQEALNKCREIIVDNRYESRMQLSDGCFYHIYGCDSEKNYRSFWISMGEVK